MYVYGHIALKCPNCIIVTLVEEDNDEGAIKNSQNSIKVG